MRKAGLFILTMFLFFAGAAFAQDGTPEKKATALTDRMKTQLTLTDDQYKQVYDVNLDFVTQLGALKADAGSKMSKFRKMKTIDNDRDAALKKILSADQFSTFQTNKEENRKEMKEKYKESKQ
jgi:hypothetical protein